MNKQDKTILVTGITGQQGGATARHLLASGFKVRGLTRNPQKPATQTLAAAGAEIVAGDYDDRAALDRAVAGVYGVFSVQTPFEAGPESETRHGIAIADAAHAAGVKHFVYTSVGGAERNSGIPHFESKWAVEQHIQALGLPATILRPVFFMENFNSFFAPKEQDGTLVLAIAMQPEKPLQLIYHDDIGAFAALAFSDPDKTIGQALELAGDSLTMPRIVELMGAAIGKPVSFYPLSIEQVRSFNDDFARMFEWFNASGYAADIPALRSQYPGLMDFTTWLRVTHWQPNP